MDHADKNYLKSNPKPESKAWAVLGAVLGALTLIVANYL